MRQLLIVKSPAALGDVSPIDKGLTSHSVKDLSGLANGAISFMELGSLTSTYDTALTKNFAIALGRPNGQIPFIISEVDLNTLSVVKALPRAGAKYSLTFTMPTTVVGKEYTLRIFKKGVVPHERNSWTVSIVAKTTTPGTEATALVNAVNASMGEYFTASASGAGITITAKDNTDWEIKPYDELAGTSTTPTSFKPAIGDKAYVQHLASVCAAGKGFEYTEAGGREFIPGYPEEVEDFTLNTSGSDDTSTSGYAIYTLRFAVGRNASKQHDERVWQIVYIAIPVDDPDDDIRQIAAIDTLLANSIEVTLADHETRIKALESE